MVQNNIAIASCQWKPIGHTLVRRLGASSPLVKADADNSLPMESSPVNKGTIRYSSISIGLRHEPTFLSRIASRIAEYSSLIVGKNRNITETGIVKLLGICKLSIAATNSLTVVVNIKKLNIDIPGNIFVNIAIIPVKRIFTIAGKCSIA